VAHAGIQLPRLVGHFVDQPTDSNPIQNQRFHWFLLSFLFFS
jgi:hypothetical protein